MKFGLVSKNRIGIIAFALLAICITNDAAQAKHPRIKKLYSSPIEPLEDKSFKKKDVFLTGGIKHSESLPPLKSVLKIGAEYDEMMVEKPPPSRDWYQVPSWLAGTWESDTQTDVIIDKKGRRIIGNSIRSHGVADYGKQKDGNGAIWDYVYVPVNVESETSTTLNKDVTTKQVILKNTSDLIVLKDMFTRRRINKASKKIIDVVQMEQLSSIQPLSKDKIELLGSLKEFDSKGQTRGLTTAIIVYKRVKPFQPVDFDKTLNQQVRPSFELFLKNRAKEKSNQFDGEKAKKKRDS